MIRKAGFDDIPLIAETYDEHFQYEEEHGAFTVFRKDIYPTGRDAENTYLFENYALVSKTENWGNE